MDASAASGRMEAARVLGAGKMAEVLEHGPFVLKLYRAGVPKENSRFARRRSWLRSRGWGCRRRG